MKLFIAFGIISILLFAHSSTIDFFRNLSFCRFLAFESLFDAFLWGNIRMLILPQRKASKSGQEALVSEEQLSQKKIEKQLKNPKI